MIFKYIYWNWKMSNQKRHKLLELLYQKERKNNNNSLSLFRSLIKLSHSFQNFFFKYNKYLNFLLVISFIQKRSSSAAASTSVAVVIKQLQDEISQEGEDEEEEGEEAEEDANEPRLHSRTVSSLLIKRLNACLNQHQHQQEHYQNFQSREGVEKKEEEEDIEANEPGRHI